MKKEETPSNLLCLSTEHNSVSQDSFTPLIVLLLRKLRKETLGEAKAGFVQAAATAQ